MVMAPLHIPSTVFKVQDKFPINLLLAGPPASSAAPRRFSRDNTGLGCPTGVTRSLVCVSLSLSPSLPILLAIRVQPPISTAARRRWRRRR